MIVREFLYVDPDKVRGMLAQLDGGIAETQRSTERDGSDSVIGLKGYLSHHRARGGELETDKSLGDALFPMLEEALESEGILSDLSNELAGAPYWERALRQDHEPGTVVRISALGSLYDSRYVAASFAGFATASLGISELATRGNERSRQQQHPGAGAAASRGAQVAKRPKSKSVEHDGALESTIPDFPGDGLVDGEMLRAIVRVSRGLFKPGLHLYLSPVEDGDHIISVRLQEGRQFLDSDMEVLFARYGFDKQEWTVVGTIGHYSTAEGSRRPTFGNLVDSASSAVSRARLMSQINLLMRTIGARGLIDVPQYPGFSVVPLAVYRTIPIAARHAGVNTNVVVE